MLACRSIPSQTRTIAYGSTAQALETGHGASYTPGRVQIYSNVCSMSHAGTSRMA